MSIAQISNNYQVGRGEAYFAPFVSGNGASGVPGGESFLGDVNALSVTLKATLLDHYQSTGGVKTIDQSATIQSDSSGSLVTENINTANLALFFFGTTSAVTTTAATVAAEVMPTIVQGLYYNVGVTPTDPVGVKGLNPATPVVLTSNPSGTTYVAGTDYLVDYPHGRIYIIPGGAITAGTTPLVTYTKLAASKPRVISGTTPIEGALHYLGVNSVGNNLDYYMPWVKLTPNGSFELIGDKFAMLTFDLKVLKKGTLPSLFIDGQPA
jgi:hypothetical protein